MSKKAIINGEEYEIEDGKTDADKVVEFFLSPLTEEELREFKELKQDFEQMKALYEAKRKILIEKADGKKEVKAGALTLKLTPLAPRFPWKTWAIDHLKEPTPEDVTKYLKKPQEGEESFRVDVE